MFKNLKFAVLGAGLATVLPPFSWPALIIFLLFIPFLENIFFEKASQRFLSGLFFGLGYFLVLLKWLSVVGTDALFALSVICSLWWAIASILSAQFKESKFWPVWFAVVWSALEILRDRLPWGGFGWGQLGIIWVDTPFSGLYSLLGQIGMTFVTYLLIALSFILSQRWRQNKISVNLFRISIVAAISFALSNVSYAVQPISVDTSKSIEIVAVQGGVERTGLGVLGEPRAVLERHISQTLKNLSEINSSDLLVWPESSIDLDPDRDSETMELLQSLDEKVEPAILANATFYKPDTVKNNVSILIDENQFKMVYQKRRLVPFGEFLPLRSLIEAYTDRASMLSNDYQPGTAAGSIDVSGIKIGLLICFEIADDSLIHDGIEQQSAVIVQTNNATYQYLGQSEQQGLYTRLRAIEVGRPIVSISTSGISLIVNERGQVVHQLTQDQVGLLSTEFHWREGETFATKIHDLWLFLIVGAFISGSILMIRRSSKIKS